MSRARLTPSEIEKRLQERSDWVLNEAGDTISRRFVFKNFVRAFGFMSECAFYAEKIDHHPEWTNVYKNIDVRLSTHSSKGVTELDFDLAAFMDEAAKRH
jgi:4a-hydroxytetrahydrobiopterin dehydratase